jgi:Radical SAM superfamily/Iron-sulfur cluster-binding domain
MSRAWAARRLRGRLEAFLALPPVGGFRPTWRRRWNLYLTRYEHLRGRTKLRSYPTRLVVEPASACNLRCPYCFTGAGEVGRERGLMPLDLYRRVLGELGDYLFELELFHWGEPLLHPQLEVMIREAAERGIATTVNTNLAVPFDAARAERLVGSGLTELTISIDGATQETYEKYRVRGRLGRVLKNCRLVAEARRRLGPAAPRCNLEFHAFPHNAGDAGAIRALAAELGMGVRVFKGVVPGKEWGKDTEFEFCVSPVPTPCIFLWGTAFLNSDGGCAPCRGTFYADDDIGTLAASPGAPGASSFAEIWNGSRYRAARALFQARGGDAAARRSPCFDCPNTIMWERWKEHRAAGGEPQSFDAGFGLNEMWNYFWQRRPSRPASRDGHSRRGEAGRETTL